MCMYKVYFAQQCFSSIGVRYVGNLLFSPHKITSKSVLYTEQITIDKSKLLLQLICTRNLNLDVAYINLEDLFET